VQRELGQEDERPALDVRHAGGPRIGESLLGLLADRRNVGKTPRGMRGEIAAPGVGSSSAARSNVLRDDEGAAAQRPAPGFLERLAAAPARSSGTAPSSSASSCAAWSRW
jgi:hypothetical protein